MFRLIINSIIWKLLSVIIWDINQCSSLKLIAIQFNNWSLICYLYTFSNDLQINHNFNDNYITVNKIESEIRPFDAMSDKKLKNLLIYSKDSTIFK